MIFLSGIIILIFNLIKIKGETYHFEVEKEIKQDFHDINPKDIHIYYFNSNTHQVDFFLEKRKGNPYMYSYHCYNAINFYPTESDLLTLSITEVLEKAKIIDTTMILKLNLVSPNIVTEEDQIVIIVYCSQSESCDYSILFQDFNLPIRLEENQPFYFPLFSNYNQNFSIPQDTIPETEPFPVLKIVNNIITGGGLIYVYQFDESGEEVEDEEAGLYGYSYVSNLNILYYKIQSYKPTHQIIIKVNSPDIASISSISFSWIKSMEDDITTESFLRRTVIEIHKLKTNNDLILHLDNVFPQNSFVYTYLKSQNCYINVIDDNKNITSVDFFYKKVEKSEIQKDIKVSINKYKNSNLTENGFCVLHTYSISPSDIQYNLLIHEEIPVTFVLNNEISRLVLTYPMLFSNEQNTLTYNFLQLNINIPENEAILIKVIYDGIIPANLNYTTIDKNQTIYLGMNYQLYCLQNTICNVFIEVVSRDINKEIPVTIQLTNENAICYMEKNEMNLLHEGPNFRYIFYTDVEPGQKIKLIGDYTTNSGEIEAKFWNKEKFNLASIDFYTYNKRYYPSSFSIKYSYYFKETLYTVPKKNCKTGCELLFQDSHASIEHGVIMKSNIAVYDYKEPIKSQLNLKITGHLEDKDTKIAHKFTLPLNVKKFMIVIEGENILFTITANPPSSCVLDSPYTATNGTAFIEKEIIIDNSEINVEVILEMSNLNLEKFNEYESFYEIKVIPYVHLLNKPLFIINDIRQIETYTGKDNDTVYLVYEKDEPLEDFNTFIYVSPSKNKYVNFEIQYCHYQKGQIEKKIWDEYFNCKDEKKIQNNYYEFRLTNSQLIKYYFIKIITKEPAQYLNVYFSRDASFRGIQFLKGIFDRKPLLYYTSVNSFDLEPGEFGMKYEAVFESINEEDTPLSTKLFSPIHNYTLSGQLSILNDEDEYVLFTLTRSNQKKDQGIALLASRKVIIPKENKTIIQLSPYKKNQIRIPANTIKFPFTFEFTIDPNYPDMIINIKLRRTNIQLTDLYTFTNLNFIGCYAVNEKEEVNEDLPIIILKPIQSIAVYKFKNKSKKMYNKIRITISEKIKEKDENILNNLKFEVISIISSEKLIVPLVHNNYFYSIFDNDSKTETYYIDNLSGDEGKIKVELGISDNEHFIISFNYPNDTQINPTEITSSYEFGKYIYTFNTSSEYVKMNIAVDSTKNFKNNVDYIVKVSVKDKYKSFNEYVFENNTFISELKGDYNIHSSWENLKNKDKKIDLDIMYYYVIYSSSFNYSMSICIPNETVYNKFTNNTELMWVNPNQKYFEYTTEILIYFEDNEGEHLFAYKTKQINGYKFPIFIIITLISFIGVFGLIGLATYLVYKQIKIYQKEEEDNENIEIFGQIETDSFTQQH